MENNNYLDSVEEIKKYILDEVREKKWIFFRAVSLKCSDESKYDRALNELLQEGKVKVDDSSICRVGYLDEIKDKKPDSITPDQNTSKDSFDYSKYQNPKPMAPNKNPKKK